MSIDAQIAESNVFYVLSFSSCFGYKICRKKLLDCLCRGKNLVNVDHPICYQTTARQSSSDNRKSSPRGSREKGRKTGNREREAQVARAERERKETFSFSLSYVLFLLQPF